MSNFMFTMLTVATCMLVLVWGLVKVSDHRRRPVDPAAQALDTKPASPKQRHRAYLVLFSPAAFIAYTWIPGGLGVPFETDRLG